MAPFGDQLRRAVAANEDAPRVWSAGVCALVGIGVGAGIAAAVGLQDAALPAGFVAALAGVGGALVPRSWTRQVAVPAGIAVAVAPPLALLGEGRPWVACVLAAAVFAIGTLAQADAPTGSLVGALGSTAYVLSVGMALVRDVSLWHALWAGVIGLGTAALVTAGTRAVRGWLVRHRGAAPGPELPRLPGSFATRLGASMSSAAHDWRSHPFARLAVRRVLVLAPLVAILEAWRDPIALYSLIVAFSVTQPLAGDTLERVLARTAGVIGAIIVTVALSVVAPDWVVALFAVLAMVTGLAYLLRSPFVTALGTTVLTVATGVLAGTSTAAGGRLLATLAGGAVGVLATLLVPAPPATTGAPQPS